MKTNSKKKLVQIIIGVIILTSLSIYGFIKILHSVNYEETDNAQIETNAVPVVNRIAGYINNCDLQDYQEVKAGDLLISIDDAEFQIAVTQAESDLRAAFADLKSAQSQVNISIANQNFALNNSSTQNVRFKKSISDLKRDQSLFKEGAITKKQLEDTRSTSETAAKILQANKSEVRQVTSQNGNIAADIEKAKATIQIRQADLEAAKLKLSFTKIYASATGRIGKVNLHKGQFVNSGQNLMSIINNEKFWIVANFKETQIEHLRIGQPVSIILEGFQDKDFTGKITSMSDATGAKFTLLPPDNSSGNFVKVIQRIPVKIEFDNFPQVKKFLKAGLSASIDVKLK